MRLTVGGFRDVYVRKVYMAARILPELPTSSILTAGVLSLLLLPTRLNILQHGCAVSCGQLSTFSSVLEHIVGRPILLPELPGNMSASHKIAMHLCEVQLLDDTCWKSTDCRSSIHRSPGFCDRYSLPETLLLTHSDINCLIAPVTCRLVSEALSS